MATAKLLLKQVMEDHKKHDQHWHEFLEMVYDAVNDRVELNSRQKRFVLKLLSPSEVGSHRKDYWSAMQVATFINSCRNVG